MRKILLALFCLLMFAVPGFAKDANPQAIMSYPADGMELFPGQMVGIAAVAISNVGIKSIDYYIDDQLQCSNNYANNTINDCRWIVPLGKPFYKIHAVATDSKGVQVCTQAIFVHRALNVAVPDTKQPPPQATAAPPPPQIRRGKFAPSPEAPK